MARLAELVCPSTGRALRLRRGWPRGTGHLLLQYVEVDDSGRTLATVAGQWFADGDQFETVARQTAAAFPALVTTINDRGLMLQRGGADRRLRALTGILGHPESTLLVHRPERRAVVRRSGPAATTYLKVVRPDGRSPELGAMPLEGLGGARTPVAIASDASTGTVECSALPGRALHELLGDAGVSQAETSAAFRATGAAVRGLHESPPPAGARHHDAASEAEVTDRWTKNSLAHGVLSPAEAAAARSALADVHGRLAGLTAAASSLIHRDLHDKQILVDDHTGVGLLDLDTLAIGDPALDVANLFAHLQLRVLQGHATLDAAHVAADAFLEGYHPAPPLMERMVAYAAASRLRLACVYAFRPRWRGLAGQLLDVDGDRAHVVNACLGR